MACNFLEIVFLFQHHFVFYITICNSLLAFNSAFSHFRFVLNSLSCFQIVIYSDLLPFPVSKLQFILICNFPFLIFLSLFPCYPNLQQKSRRAWKTHTLLKIFILGRFDDFIEIAHKPKLQCCPNQYCRHPQSRFLPLWIYGSFRRRSPS